MVIKSWTGPAVAGLIVAGIVAILVVNIQPGGTSKPSGPPTALPESTDKPPVADAVARGAREIPIGDPVVRNHVRVAAVYLSAVAMEGMDAPAASTGSGELIHLEADVKATEDNPNGFAKYEFVPYLEIAYEIVPAGGGSAVDRGKLTPMVAWDGLHYGANVALPKAGDYRLVYEIQPPSKGGLGRHSDPATGVAPWWEPFRASFDWTVEPSRKVAAQ